MQNLEAFQREPRKSLEAVRKQVNMARAGRFLFAKMIGEGRSFGSSQKHLGQGIMVPLEAEKSSTSVLRNREIPIRECS
jgi:hypothetical protein